MRFRGGDTGMLQASRGAPVEANPGPWKSHEAVGAGDAGARVSAPLGAVLAAGLRGCPREWAPSQKSSSGCILQSEAEPSLGFDVRERAAPSKCCCPLAPGGLCAQGPAGSASSLASPPFCLRCLGLPVLVS